MCTKYMNGHYYSLNQYLREQFGCKVYKVALSGGYTCPNRDGTLGTGGCIFCSESGSGDFAAERSLNVKDQIRTAAERIRTKTSADHCIAYFQTFTTTYAPISYIESLLSQAVSVPEVAAVSLGTRPDCLPADVLRLLERFNRIKPVWVELGLQTIHERSAHYIRRGYPLSDYDNAVAHLHDIGINVVTHVILGLPDESVDEMLETVRYAGSVTNGIKLQLLHILKGTDLAADYLNGKFSALTMDEYIDIICRCIEVLPQEVVIHRLTGDGSKSLLIAPLWSGNKKLVLNTLNRELSRRNIVQGSNAK